MKIKKNLLILSFTLVYLSSFSQQLPDFSLFRENAFLYNPAVAGTDQRTVVGLSIRKQWTNIKQSPTTAVAYYQTSIEEKNFGVGASIFNDFIGPTNFTGISGAFAYNIIFSKDRRGVSYYKALSFGLSASIMHYRINGTKILLDQPQDNAILAGKSSQFFPDAAFGIYYKSRNIFASLSIPQLIQLNMPFNAGNGQKTKFKKMQHYYAMVGGRIFLAKDRVAANNVLYLEPAINFHYVINSIPQAMISTRFAMKDVFFVGIGYRTLSTLMMEGGFTIKEQFSLAYAYDMAAGNVRKNVGQVHEISLTFNFGKHFGAF